MIIDLSLEIEGFEKEINEEQVEKFVREVISQEYEEKKSKECYVSIVLLGNEEIQEINREYRDIDAPTDVISFAFHEGEEVEDIYDTLGDIVISLERVKEQSVEYGHSFEREFYYVLTHGILHLLGYDHIEEEDKNEMREKEEAILEQYNLRR